MTLFHTGGDLAYLHLWIYNFTATTSNSWFSFTEGLKFKEENVEKTMEIKWKTNYKIHNDGCLGNNTIMFMQIPKKVVPSTLITIYLSSRESTITGARRAWAFMQSLGPLIQRFSPRSKESRAWEIRGNSQPSPQLHPESPTPHPNCGSVPATTNTWPKTDL